MSNSEDGQRRKSAPARAFRDALARCESALREQQREDAAALLDAVCVSARHESIPPEQLLVELKAMIERAVSERSLDEREAVRRHVIEKAIETYFKIDS